MSPRRLTSEGFTLVEVIVALTVSAIVITMAYEFTAGIADAAAEAVKAARGRAAELNGRRWLRAALGSIEPPTDSFAFDGNRHALTFTARIRQPQGWVESERVRVDLVDTRLMASRSKSGPATLATDIRAVEFDYADRDGGTGWLRVWLSYASTPTLVRLRIHRTTQSAVDTLLLLVHDRR